ncbi:PREDICTED: uncharacterized protein LOC109484859 [Branchiostoma belcheri]|uniref:Uncharacterized protein LOC109484859 n=1 Tax=Branchiostoma belcheri TaxID=7741 RepID=A0A6P5AC27_BRABE|nr:PREDICTED: uncharacterized protein LOC109484859 [Branchiostoma belcheri]
MAKLIILLLAGFVSAAMANTRTCFCEIRTSTSRSDPIFLDVPNPLYRHWLHLTCSTAKQSCPDDCRRAAANALGGSVHPLNNDAGAAACARLKRQVTPDNPVHLYAHYSTSSCDHRGYQYLGELCCWEINFGPAYPVHYLHNPSCSADQHPLGL